MRRNEWNNCLRPRGGGLLGGGLGTYFVSRHGSKLGVSGGSVVRTLVGISGWETGVEVLAQ